MFSFKSYHLDTILSNRRDNSMAESLAFLQIFQKKRPGFCISASLTFRNTFPKQYYQAIGRLDWDTCFSKDQPPVKI